MEEDQTMHTNTLVTMVHVLVLALAALYPPEAEASNLSSERLIQSALIRIGKFLRIPSCQHPAQRLRHRSVFKPIHDADIAGPSSSITPSSAGPVSVISATTSSTRSSVRRSIKTAVSMASPERRRKKTPLSESTNTNSTNESSSPPRNNAKSKRTKLSPTQPPAFALTDSLGWRRLLIDEIVNLEVNDEFVLVIPADIQREIRSNKTARADIKNMVIESIIASSPAMCQQGQTQKARREIAHQHLIDKHGIARNDSTYIELRCRVVSYPHHEYYATDDCCIEEVKKHILNDAGLHIRLIDYPRHLPLRLRWRDMSAIQIFLPHIRGDYRSKVTLYKEYSSPLYGQELDHKLRQVQGDPLLTVELQLSHEQQKSAHLERRIQKMNDTRIMENGQLAADFIKGALKDEMQSSRLTEFANTVDKVHYNRWLDHYSNFQSNVRLLPGDTANRIYEGIQQFFPFNFTSLQSMMFGQRSHEPARAKKDGYARKMRILTHKFLGMIRDRNPHLLVHWALVSTIALFFKNVCMKHARNFIMKSCTTTIQTAFEKLDALYDATLPERLKLLRQLQLGCHSSDNYQQYHPYKTQRCGAPGVYHNGMVYNFVMAKEFTKPPGTIIEHLLTGHRWIVIKSRLIDHWCCEVTLERIAADDDPQLQSSSSSSSSSSLERTVVQLPHLQWKIVSMVGEALPVDITYVKQDVPPSLRQKIPPRVDDTTFVLGAREWMKDAQAQPREDAVPVTPRKFIELLHDCERIKELFTFDPTFDNSITPRYECLKVFKEKMTNLLELEPTMYNAARTFRIDCLRNWNEAYSAVDKFMWFPITPHDEMKKDEAMLAMAQIFCDLGFVEENESNEYILCPEANRRFVFQYGDVLTIQKWYQLGIAILRKSTHIGKEEFVEMMMSVYNNFIKCHDYLHENIHRLQFIFTIYYGGFIQACQVLLGTKRIRQDPTKGKWRDSEILTMKIYWSLRQVRLEEFLQKFMERDDAMVLLDGKEKDPRDVIWLLEKEYQAYCDSLEDCPCQKSRAAALFMKYTQEWLLCHDGVPLGDWVTLEVQGHDWLPRWFCVKKPQYREECQRRIEKLYALPVWILEYLRMNRFVRMSDGGRFLSLDDFCEKHNLAQKLSTKNMDFSIVCKRSRHLSAAQRCAKELFGDEKKKKSRSRMAVYDDVKALYEYFRKVDIFTTPEVEYKLTEKTFWEHVIPANFNDTDEKKKKKQRSTVKLTEVKKGMLRTFFDATYDSDDSSSSHSESEADDEDDDNSIDTVASHNSVGSVGSTNSGMSILSDISSSNNADSRSSKTNAEVDLGSVEAQVSALKRLGNVSRCPMNMLMIKNLHKVGMKKMEKADVVAQRKMALQEEKCNSQIIYDCVTLFKGKMAKIMSNLKLRKEKLNERRERELEDWEQEFVTELNIKD